MGKKIWCHWQNLNEKKFGKMGTGLLHGRAWLHIAAKCIGVEWSLRSHFCHARIGIGGGDSNYEWTFSLALPPLAIWVHFDGFQLLRYLTPKKKCIATWDGGREFEIADEREIAASISDWTIRFNPWSKQDEWSRLDPWWVRGVSLNLPDLLLGRTRYTCEEIERFDIQIPMPEKIYLAKVTIEHRTWKRRLGRAAVRRDAKVDIPGGIPFPGKGENSWDCGMDGLFGYGCDSTKPEAIIAEGVKSVLESRRRYAGSVEWTPVSA